MNTYIYLGFCIVVIIIISIVPTMKSLSKSLKITIGIMCLAVFLFSLYLASICFFSLTEKVIDSRVQLNGHLLSGFTNHLEKMISSGDCDGANQQLKDFNKEFEEIYKIRDTDRLREYLRNKGIGLNDPSIKK